ncbi:MAG: hypothetical protein CVV44_07650 [Spirochaetae bacterium HGW-Spirochaetae-1]|jgi:AcrR family transcriptional regulator|nr:MAG: hypothetical protein CVV44_07650 [Spirochaetae bacterium HGW-Spirochaetae-1]
MERREIPMKKYHKETFDNIPGEKREKVLRTAMKEFSKNGLTGTKVGDIAKKAGISHGSMYSYFPTKDALINTIIFKGYELQKNGLSENPAMGRNIFDRLGAILSYAQQLAKNDPDIISIWSEMSFEFNSRFSKQIIKLEEEAILFWKYFIEEGKKEGSIDVSIDTDSAAYCIDSIVGTLMKSYISRHERMKLSIHFGNNADNDDKVVSSIMTLVRNMLKP